MHLAGQKPNQPSKNYHYCPKNRFVKTSRISTRTSKRAGLGWERTRVSGTLAGLGWGAPRESNSCVYCCIAISGLPGFCTGGTRTLPFPTQRIVSQVTPQRVANLLRALLLVGASNHVKPCPADHRSATDTLRTLSSRR